MDTRQKLYIIYRSDLFGDKVYIPRVFTSRFSAQSACRDFNFWSCKFKNFNSYNFEPLTPNNSTYERRFENQGLHD